MWGERTMREYSWFKYERTEHAMSFINHEFSELYECGVKGTMREYSVDSEYSWLKIKGRNHATGLD